MNDTPPNPFRNAAYAALQQGRIPDAAMAFAELISTEPNDPAALMILAAYCIVCGDLTTAKTVLSAFGGLYPDDPLFANRSQFLNRYESIVLKNNEIRERMIRRSRADAGFDRTQVPCLIELNGDLLWIPGDLLQFIWHTVREPIDSPAPQFFAETGHYHWIQERLRPGQIAFDVGANIGIFSTMMSACVGPTGRVHAFEPSPKSAQDLRRVLAMNGISNVVVNQAAVCDRVGSALFDDLQEEDVRREASHLTSPSRSHMTAGLKQNQIEVETVTLDAYAQEHRLRPSVIKVDVEGAEFEVLEGSRALIAACLPLMVIEIHAAKDGSFDHERLNSYLNSFGYKHSQDDKTVFCWR